MSASSAMSERLKRQIQCQTNSCSISAIFAIQNLESRIYTFLDKENPQYWAFACLFVVSNSHIGNQFSNMTFFLFQTQLDNKTKTEQSPLSCRDLQKFLTSLTFPSCSVFYANNLAPYFCLKTDDVVMAGSHSLMTGPGTACLHKSSASPVSLSSGRSQWSCG